MGRVMEPPCMSCGGPKDRRPPRGCRDARSHARYWAAQIDKAEKKVAAQDEAAAKAERQY